MSINEAFNKSAKYYDKWIKKAISCFDDLFTISIEIIPFPKESKIRVLDLGAGTGLFSKFIIDKYPNAEFVLYDVADKMLEVARDRFKDNLNKFEFIVDDYKNIKTKKIGSFDLIISSLSIHHLENSEKQKLFKASFDVLNKKGVFINVDEIKGETDYTQKLYWNNWLQKIRDNKIPEDQIEASIQRRKKYDRESTLFDQIKWLKQAGFSDVDCVYKNYFIGIFFGMKIRN